MPRIKVLISGAGITGNALAFWLTRLGHDVTVTERFPVLRTSGLQIDLRGHGIDVLRHMGLEQAFRALAAPEQGLRIVDGSGRQRAYFPANASGQGLQSFTSEFEIMRGDLCRLMYDGTRGRARYLFGTTVHGFEDRGDSVEVRLSDGCTDRFDLLIGADGQGSSTRKMMLGSGTPDAFRPLGGEYVGYFTMPRPVQEGEAYVCTSYMATGRRGILVRRHSPHTVQVYLGCKPESDRLERARRAGDVAEQKATLAEIFRGAGWETDELLAALDTADDFYLECLGIVRLDSWSRGGRVALVGDAAYCPSANTGMGTTSGIVGAYILAGEIGRQYGRGGDKSGGDVKKDGFAIALAEYEQKFRPFMNQVTKGIGEDKVEFWKVLSSGPLGLAVLHGLLGLASFLKVNIGKWVIREDVKNWDLPVYEEMQE